MASEWINKWRSVKNNSTLIKALLKPLKPNELKKNHQAINNIHNEVFEKIDCLECANCCKSIPPIVSSRDTKRIARHLGMSKQDFHSRYLITDSDGDTVINASPCPFLEEDSRCQIYEVRPNACRQYPHSGEFQFVENLGLHRQNINYCPALYEIIRRINKKMEEGRK